MSGFFCFVLFFSQNALIQDLENCQKQLEEFHHTRVSMALVNYLKTIKKNTIVFLLSTFLPHNNW